MKAEHQAKVDDIQQRIRELDALVHEFREELIKLDQGPRSHPNMPPSDSEQHADARDHLQQIHFRLTECKGHLGSVKYNLKNVER